MYCSRRGRTVPRPTDTCARCGRCNWEQNQETGNTRNPSLAAALLIGIAVLLAAARLFLG